MSYGRAAVLIISFFLDVHVRADVVTAAPTARRTVEAGMAHATLAQGSLIAVRDGDVRLVRGSIYVRGPATVVTPFARFTCADAEVCAALFRRGDDRVFVDSLSPGWSMVRTGDRTEYGIDVATRVIVGAVDPTGRAETEPPQALVWSELIARWAALYPADFASFAVLVRELRPRWDESVERLSTQHAARAVAMVAERDRARADRARAAAARDADDAELRRLFREKNYVAP